MNSPTISVVMSVFNGQGFLPEAVDSILNQSFRDIEFVVIDDGSTDRTAEILAEYAARDARVRVRRHENMGRAASLNVGIGLAKAPYIARMDADDVALPHRFKEQLEFMARNPEVGLLGGAYERMSREGEFLETVRPPIEDSEIRSLMLRYNPMCHPAVIMRKEVVLASGGYREALLDADDYDLWLRMVERCQVANLDQCILRYRIHSKQVSILNSSDQALCVLAARTAASLRKEGRTDPLSGVEKVTPGVLRALGVTESEIQNALLDAYRFWLDILEPSDPETALGITNGLLNFAGSGCFEPRVLADVWLKAASLHYRQGRPAKALVSAARAFLARPIVMGRPVKKAYGRIASALKS